MPGYSLAASLGLVVAAVDLQAPAIMFLAFLPMLFIAAVLTWVCYLGIEASARTSLSMAFAGAAPKSASCCSAWCSCSSSSGPAPSSSDVGPRWSVPTGPPSPPPRSAWSPEAGPLLVVRVPDA